MIRTTVLPVVAFIVTYAVLVGLVAQFANIGPVDLLLVLLLAAGVAVLVGRAARRTTA